MQKSHRRHILISFLVVLCVFVLLWFWTPSDLSNPDCKFKRNAAWVSVDWVSHPVDETAVRHLAESADSRGLQYLFLYVSYFKPDGSFNPSYDYAGEFIKDLTLEMKNKRKKRSNLNNRSSKTKTSVQVPFAARFDAVLAFFTIGKRCLGVGW